MRILKVLFPFTIVLLVNAQVLLRTDCRGDIFSYESDVGCGHHHAVIIPWTTGNACQCVPPRTTYRSDTRKCVEKLDDCLQVPFDQTPSAGDGIPLVSGLVHDHLVYFGAHLELNKVIHFDNFACRVSHEKYLTSEGWLPLSNLTSSNEFTFQLCEIVNRQIGLHYLNSANQSWKFEGQLIRVGLSCKTSENANIVPHPCIAFRVGGLNQIYDMKAISEKRQSSSGESGRLNKWLIVSLGAGLLGLTYVLAILVYVILKKQNESPNSNQRGIASKLCSLKSFCMKGGSKHVERTTFDTNRRARMFCDSCMTTNTSVLNWVSESGAYFEAKRDASYKDIDNNNMSNVTVVSVGGESGNLVSHKRISRSKSDVGQLTSKSDWNNHRKSLMAKRSESMVASKSVSFDPVDVIIDPSKCTLGDRKLVTFASLPSVKDEAVCQMNSTSTGLASILKRTEPIPPRLLLNSFCLKQRRDSDQSGKSKMNTFGPEDLGYHSSDSERLSLEKSKEIFNFDEAI